MYMSKQPVSVTLDRDNLLWLRGRAAATKRRSLSDALDEIVRAARLRGQDSVAIRSVVGTIDIATDDPLLERADQAVRAIYEESMATPMFMHDGPDRGALKGRRRG